MSKADPSKPQEASGEPLIPAGKRAKALSAVVEGLSDVQAGKRAGLDRQTVGALRRSPSFAAEVERELQALKSRRLRAIESAALVGLRRLKRDANTNPGDSGTRAAIELAKLGLSVKSEISGKDGGPVRAEVAVSDSLDKLSDEEIVRAARAILDAERQPLTPMLREVYPDHARAGEMLQADIDRDKRVLDSLLRKGKP